MIVRLKSGAALSRRGDAFGFGQVTQSMLKYLPEYGVTLTDDPKKADIQVTLTAPHFMWEAFHWWARDRHPCEVLYTTWENTSFPVGWDIAMKGFKAIFATSVWFKQICVENGVELPIHVVQHGVDAEKFPFMERDFQSERFQYLWQGMHMQDRKNGDLVERAWKELNLPNAWLIKKIYPMQSKPAQDIIDEDHRIIYYRRFMERDEYNHLLQGSHVSVNPTRGEGFGLMPLECSSTGMATIVTGWSGPMDYIRTDCMRSLKYKLSEKGGDFYWNCPDVYFDVTRAQDAEVDFDDLKDAMLEYYEDREMAKAHGETASKYVGDEWTWEKVCGQFVRGCESVLNGNKNGALHGRHNGSLAAA